MEEHEIPSFLREAQTSLEQAGIIDRLAMNMSLTSYSILVRGHAHVCESANALADSSHWFYDFLSLDLPSDPRKFREFHEARLECLEQVKAYVEHSRRGIWDITRSISNFAVFLHGADDNNSIGELLMVQLGELQRHAAKCHLKKDQYFALPLQDFLQLGDSDRAPWRIAKIEGLWDDLSFESVVNWSAIGTHSGMTYGFAREGVARLISDEEKWWHPAEHKLRYPFIPDPYELGGQLLTYGLENKRFYSPLPHQIMIESEDIHSVTVIDLRDRIAYKVRTSDDKISLGFIEINDNGTYTFLNSNYSALLGFGIPECDRKQQFRDADLRTYTGLVPLVCAIARDMFVLEERDAHYTVEERTVGGGRRGGSRIRGYKWIPRERVNFTPNANYRSAVVEVAPAHIDGHPRQLIPGHRASQRQLDLAARDRVVVPAGYTYVGDYDRGGHVRSEIYKSRSALHVLFN